ncbi:MAG: hypothetical protein QNJ63_16355 [Calothrix sp. MO_192.B10]|nr:hypothetical protein [Calothrix sp. MO_192.B10]
MIKATLLILSIVFFINLICSFIYRFRFGATIEQLIETKFYEIIPIRSLFWGLFCECCYVLVFTSFATLNNLCYLIFSESRSIEDLWKLLLSSSLTFVFFNIFKSLKASILEIPPINPLPIKADGLSIRYGIHPRLLKTLGFERFPNEKSPHNIRNRIVRFLVAIIGVACIGLSFYLLFINDTSNLGIDFDTPINNILSQTLYIQTPFILATIATIPTLIVLILFNNRNYTILTFNQSLLIKVGIVLLSIFCLTYLKYSFYTITVIVTIIVSFYGLRMIADLFIEFRYARNKRVYNPIAEKIKEHTPYLDQISTDPQLKLGSLQKDELVNRISRGCQNLEERGIFVVRNFARFLNLIEVQHQEFATAMLRYLTVRRYMTCSVSSGTHRPLQRPTVPMWDYSLFPLHPPNGYMNWVDPLWLPSRWDIVEICFSCGGTGIIITTKTETDSKGRTSTTTETHTCSTCGGSGRLKKTQILNTQWQKLIPIVTHPDIPTPELTENAEEKIFYRLPITENFVEVGKSATSININNPTLQEMHQTGRELKEFHKLHHSKVEKLHDGYLYRADFQIGSFRMIMIKFLNLGGSFGWFFGKRPEFYFPKLPLSYSAVLTFILLPPLGFALLISLIYLSVNVWYLIT